jgi:hypothetical protein
VRRLGRRFRRPNANVLANRFAHGGFLNGDAFGQFNTNRVDRDIDRAP